MLITDPILIVEDEPKVAGFIKKGLEEEGFQVDIAYDGLIGKSLFLTKSYSLIILDLNLPLLNGFQLCELIRLHNTQIPILMLTALSRIEEKVKGFDSGADDYLLKPFEFKELVLRIKALLKRTSIMPLNSQIIRIADLEINRDIKKVKRADTIIDLTAKEYNLLEFLALNKEKVFSRMELVEQLWGINFDTGTNVVDVYINFLRKKMDNDFNPKLIHTKIGLGYYFSENEDTN